MTKRTKLGVLLAVFGALLLSALIGIGVGLYRHTEPTFLLVCWQDDESAIYVSGIEGGNTGPCSTPVELHWHPDVLPLDVRIVALSGMAFDLNFDLEVQATRAAIRTINARLGYQALNFSLGHGDVLVHFGIPSELGAPVADCRHFALNGTGLAYRAEIRVRNVEGAIELHQVMVHELGHALGLAHDDYQGSVMYWGTGDVLWPESLASTWISDADAEALRNRYAKRLQI